MPCRANVTITGHTAKWAPLPYAFLSTYRNCEYPRQVSNALLSTQSVAI